MKRYTLRTALHDAIILSQYCWINKKRRKHLPTGWLSIPGYGEPARKLERMKLDISDFQGPAEASQTMAA